MLAYLTIQSLFLLPRDETCGSSMLSPGWRVKHVPVECTRETRVSRAPHAKAVRSSPIKSAELATVTTVEYLRADMLRGLSSVLLILLLRTPRPGN